MNQPAVQGRPAGAPVHQLPHGGGLPCGGGGTPDDLNAEGTSRLWGLIEQHFDLDPEPEASIEVNPEFLTRECALQLRCAMN